MKVAISQPRYLPAINYLQRLFYCDLFVFLDNVQRQSRGWENRNKILVHGSQKWITIPVSSSSREMIYKTKISDSQWIDFHKNLIANAYAKHPFFDSSIIEVYYNGTKDVLALTENDYAQTLIHMVLNACTIFGFSPKVVRASLIGGNDAVIGPEKLLSICKKVSATTYISGPNGREYGIIDIFADSGINILFHDFQYPEYTQYGQSNFVPWLSFFDIVFNIGVDAVKKIILSEPAPAEVRI